MRGRGIHQIGGVDPEGDMRPRSQAFLGCTSVERANRPWGSFLLHDDVLYMKDRWRRRGGRKVFGRLLPVADGAAAADEGAASSSRAAA